MKLANEEAILNIVEEDGTRSITEIAQEVDTSISSRSVYRVLNENRLHPFHYTRVQHLEPEDYPARRNFCVWLLNKATEDENFISRILFSDESSFGRQGCFTHRNLHVWSYDNPRATYPCAFQRRFSVNLWSGLVGDSVVSQDCKKIKKACLGILYFQIGPFEFPMRLTGAVYANFLNMELAHLLKNIPLIFFVNQL
jgi:hypothetical protein